MSGLTATFANALAVARSNRGALLSNVVAMVVNDLVWVVFWIFFVREVGVVGGWDTERILLLQAVLTSAGGLSLGLLANARRIGAMAVTGDLDAVLSLPVPPLAHVLLRRIEVIHLGDLVFGLALFAVVGEPSLARTGLFLVAVVTSATLLTGFLVLTGSLAFFAGRSETGDLGFHAMLLLGAYPVDVFTGAAKVLLYSAVPAVFVAAVPAKLIVDFDTGPALAFVGVAATFAVAGWAAFTLGLRRYTSGAVWTRA